MDQENVKPGKGFEIATALVGAAAVALFVAMFAMSGLNASERAALNARQARIAAMTSGAAPVATPASVKAWEDYRDGLAQKRSDVEKRLTQGDLNIEKYFDEFDARRGSGERFKVLYAEKTDSLYRRASPVIARDMNGQTLPVKDVFTFDEWNWPPGPEEIRIAQKKYWIIEAVTEVMLAAAGRNVPDHVAPVITRLALTNPPAELPESAVSEQIGCRLEALTDARDVPVIMAGILGPGKHGLLTRLQSVKVEKTETLKTEYEFEVEEGAPAETKPEKFLKPVRLVLDFEVVDYREQAAK